MTASRLSLYNDALIICGERRLASLTEDREPRYLLDDVWNNDGVKLCLEEGQWYFAMRGVQVDYDPDLAPPFGYSRAFSKPDDWVLTSALCTDEFFRDPLTRYVDEAGYWYSDLDTIYVRYVSNDDDYGQNMAFWPRTFTEFVVAHFAEKIVLKLSGGEARLETVQKIRKDAKKLAKNRCAMALPTSFPAQGNWSKARARGSSRRDGGNTNGSLIG